MHFSPTYTPGTTGISGQTRGLVDRYCGPSSPFSASCTLDQSNLSQVGCQRSHNNCPTGKRTTDSSAFAQGKLRITDPSLFLVPFTAYRVSCQVIHLGAPIGDSLILASRLSIPTLSFSTAFSRLLRHFARPLSSPDSPVYLAPLCLILITDISLYFASFLICLFFDSPALGFFSFVVCYSSSFSPALTDILSPHQAPLPVQPVKQEQSIIFFPSTFKPFKVPSNPIRPRHPSGYLKAGNRSSPGCFTDSIRDHDTTFC